MELSYLESLEKKYDFQYPDLYKLLCKDGMLDTGKFGSGWVDRNYERIKDNPIFLIWSSDVEAIEEFGFEDYIEDIKDPEMWWNIKPELKLIPFAQNGGGDWYCFYYNEQQGDDIPVIMIYHDADDFVVLAKNLQDFIFRAILETASSFYMSVYNENKLNKILWDARSMLMSHKKYMTEKQAAVLEDIYSKEPQKYGKVTWGLLSEDETNRIIKQEIDFPLLDKEIQYVKDDE
ncbi:MAG: SMI1/KNR4 family protein [Prevotella sp.]|jgi:hypothetical protein|nr:SMI1/KNR4 family protein [Prevotella sp.]